MTLKESDLTKCTPQFLSDTEYESKWYETFGSEEIYCAENESVVLKGNRDSTVHKMTNAYFYYSILKCTEATRKASDPKCASKS